MDRNHTKVGLINWVLLLVASVVSVMVTRYVNSIAGWMGSIILGMGVLVALITYFQMRLEERERFEKLEFDELNKAKGSSTLFTQEAEAFPAQHSREQFERFFIPFFTVLMFLGQCGVVAWEWLSLEKHAVPLVPERTLVGASVYGLIFLVLFLLGKYCSGLARLQNQRLLRPTAGYLLLGAYVSLALSASIAISAWANLPRADVFVARALAVVIAFVAIETLGGLVFEIYRPRVKGKASQMLYESRLVGLLGQPEGIFKTAAHALDYQFGFKVSETWFYKFLEKWASLIALAQIAVLFLSTAFVFVETGEEALLERFGRPVTGRDVLSAGLHFKYPWPVDKVYRYRTEKIQSFTIGVPPEEGEHESSTIVWSVAHDKEENLIVASHDVATVSTNTDKKSPPVNLLSVGIPVQFQVTNLVKWAYNNEEPNELLQKIATREVVHYLVSVDLIDIMSRGRAAAAVTLRERIQSAANARDLGAKIVFVGLEDIHPPVVVAGAYEKVIGAMQTREARILGAKAYQAQTNALAAAEAFRRLREAEADQQRAQVGALARAASFTNQLPAFNASPSVYSQRAYLQTLARASAGARKYIVATTNTTDVITLNLEDKIRADLLDVTVPGITK
ncbi:MAG: Band 7 protein [Verrucomicrobiales bacterium]|nr:Band 7 protein [Verrucomicrobiales bacterium]